MIADVPPDEKSWPTQALYLPIEDRVASRVCSLAVGRDRLAGGRGRAATQPLADCHFVHEIGVHELPGGGGSTAAVGLFGYALVERYRGSDLVGVGAMSRCAS